MTAPPVRENGSYVLDGRAYPSVTTILGVIAKPGLVRWAAKRAARLILEDPLRYYTADSAVEAALHEGSNAADRGHDVHELARRIATSTPIAADAGHPYRPAIEAFFRDIEPQVLATELTVVSRAHGYAGTLDLLIRTRDDRTWVVDWKTSRQVYLEYELQVEAYRCADTKVSPDGARQEAPDGIADSAAVVLLRPDGTYEWREVFGDLDVFLAAKRLYEWRRARSLLLDRAFQTFRPGETGVDP